MAKKKRSKGRTKPMKRRTFASRTATAAAALALAATAAFFVAGPTSAVAQQPPADLNVLPPVPTTFTPAKTPWGDYDFRGTWPIENINGGHILFQRPKQFGNRFWVNDAEFAKRVAAAKRSDGSFAQGVNARGTEGLAQWVQTSPFAHRTSMLVSPVDGQLPALTPQAEKLYKAGRSSWVPGQEYAWVDDFDTWDRCISRGFPASMFPFRYNNGIRVFQSPGIVVIELEMLGTRIVRLNDTTPWPKVVEGWMGDSRGHWEGKTLVIETSNIKSGDSATHDPARRAASPLNMASQGVPPFNTIPTSTQAHTVERLTMTGPNTITYEVTYTDPEVFTQPWTARLNWDRDDKYQFFEYACHEGDEQVRNYITASKAHIAQIAAGTVDPAKEKDSRERFAVPFDVDPATRPDTPPGAPPAGARPAAGG
jgi:hypothetical protein